jgi:hypothetical protein
MQCAATVVTKGTEEIAKQKASEEIAKPEAKERTKREAEARAKKEKEERAKKEVAAKVKQEAEAKVKQEAEARAKHVAEAEERAKQEAEERATLEVAAKVQQEAEARAKKLGEEKRADGSEEAHVAKNLNLIDEWTTADVIAFLEDLKLDEYNAAVAEHEVDGQMLQDLLVHDALGDLGIVTRLHVLKIKRAVADPDWRMAARRPAQAATLTPNSEASPVIFP